MLGRGHLVVLCFSQNPKLPQLLVQLLHVGFYPGLDGTEVVVIHLLPLGGLSTEQRPAAENKVFPLFVHGLINEKVLLLRADAGTDTLDVLVAEQPQRPHGLPVQGLHGAQQRRFLIQRLAAVGAEGRRDAEGVALDEGIGGGVPRGVAPGFKCGPQSAGGEGGGVRLALNQLLAGKLHDNAAIRGGGDEAIVLFRRDSIEGLEPVGEMGGAMGYGPVPHGGGHGVRYVGIQRGTLVNGFLQGGIDLGGQHGAHRAIIKHQTAEILRNCTHILSPSHTKKGTAVPGGLAPGHRCPM